MTDIRNLDFGNGTRLWDAIGASLDELKGIEGRRVILIFPTNDGLCGVFVGWPLAELPAVRADIAGQFMAAVALVPELAERLRAGRQAERFSGATDLPTITVSPRGRNCANSRNSPRIRISPLRPGSGAGMFFASAPSARTTRWSRPQTT